MFQALVKGFSAAFPTFNFQFFHLCLSTHTHTHTSNMAAYANWPHRSPYPPSPARSIPLVNLLQTEASTSARPLSPAPCPHALCSPLSAQALGRSPY